jgi:hypothetical protein
MRKEIYLCDVCGTEKQTTNGWYRIITTKAEQTLLQRHLLYHWDDIGNADGTVSHVCGLPDAMKQIARLEDFNA